MKRLISDNYEQLYTKVRKYITWINFQKHTTFLRLKHEEIVNLNKPITNKEIKSVLTNLPTNKIRLNIQGQINNYSSQTQKAFGKIQHPFMINLSTKWIQTKCTST